MNRISTDIASHKIEYILLIGALIVLNFFTNPLNFNADTLFPLRYAEALLFSHEVRLYVQPGPRFFPDVFYALIARLFTDKVAFHFQLTILINSTILMFALVCFFNRILKNKSSAIRLTALFLLIIPTVFLIFRHKVAYLIFIPGVHGFTATFVMVCLNYVLNLFDHKISVLKYSIFFLLTLLVSINNSLFLAMFIAPVLASLFSLKLITWQRFQIKRFLPISILLIAISFFTLVADGFWNLFPNLYTRSGNDYFSQSFIAWATDKGIPLLNDFFSFHQVGIFQIIFVISVSISLYLILIHKLKPNKYTLSHQILFLNLMNILMPVIMIIAFWVVSRNLLRYIPHIFIYSTAIFMFNVANLHSKRFQNSKIPLLKIVIIALLAFHFYNLAVSPQKLIIDKKTRFNFLMSELQQLKSNNRISDTGLSTYWIAHSGTKQYGFDILPVDFHGAPYVHALNIMDFWINDNSHKTKDFTFIVNRYKTSKQQWMLNKNSIISRFGPPTETIHVNKNTREKYEIYLYPEMKRFSIYSDLSLKLNKFFKPNQK